MIKAMQMWFDEDGMVVYREPFEFEGLAELIKWLCDIDMLDEFTTVMRDAKTPDIVLNGDGFVVVIMNFPSNVCG